jgi:spore coat polysaccharide biosynthesis predicted glycosyltransferase SpsG
MDVLIYTYGNHEMGMGHIYRMLNLASALKKRGHGILFLMPSWAEGIKKIREEGGEIKEIPIAFFEEEHVYKHLLGDRFFDCIIADALNVSENIMKLFREKTKLLLSLDNIGDGRFFSDVLINILYKCEPKLKKPKIEINSFDYLILNENFKKFNLKGKVINKKVNKILITQGGSDTYGVVPKIMDELNNLSTEIECDVLVGSAFKHHEELISSIRNSNLKINIEENIRGTWELFFDVDIAISGGGMTLFELLCVGIPCIVLTQEYKEMETINYLNELKLIDMLGLYERHQDGDLLNATIKLINNYNRRLEMSEIGKKVIDGGGCERTVDLIDECLGTGGNRCKY